MKYQIEYAYGCHTGKVRSNNEDNFWCCGETLPPDNTGTENIRTGTVSCETLPLLAVFDGMGGESCGEMASCLAAEACGDFYGKNRKKIRTAPGEFLEELCGEMNRRVCQYGKENRIASMGSTAALLVFSEEGAHGCNLGDSRIYRLDEGHFRRISTDHVLGGSLFGKAPLTQYVGVPEESMKLEPCIVRDIPEEGTRYLICSDGITDMLSDGEIADILAREFPVKETVELLLGRALNKGGRDNATLVLCEIGEKRSGGFRSLLGRFLGRREGDKE